MDVDAQDEKLANLHVDFATREIDTTCASDGGRNALSCFDSGVYKILIKRRLRGSARSFKQM